jgi:hypothetical protein
MKLGVICDGISRDLRHAVDVMDEFDLDYAELQYVGDTLTSTLVGIFLSSVLRLAHFLTT